MNTTIATTDKWLMSQQRECSNRIPRPNSSCTSLINNRDRDSKPIEKTGKSTNGIPDEVKIRPIMETAVSISGARKKIQAKLTMTKVSRIWPKPDMRNLSCMRTETNLRQKFSTIWKRPCRPPQTIKVQLAPCHKPLTRKVINRLLIYRNWETRLPPNGI